MTITKRPAAANPAAIEEFIGRAPDAGKGGIQEPVKRRKETISPVLIHCFWHALTPSLCALGSAAQQRLH